jgi:hypothetical protein
MKPLKEIKTRSQSLVIAISIGLFIIVAYTILAAFPFLQGPLLSLNPVETVEGVTRISGHTSRVSYLSINGLPVALSEDGNFSVERAYPTGYTAVTVLATDRFGRTLTKDLTFVTTPHGEK